VKACPACGSEDIKKSGWAYTEQMKYQRYACNDCGKWFRGNVAEKRNAPADRVTQIRA
jgi:transposase-like protein